MRSVSVLLQDCKSQLFVSGRLLSNIRHWCSLVYNGRVYSGRVSFIYEISFLPTIGKRKDEQKGCELLTLDETREHSIHIRSLSRSKIRGKERLKNEVIVFTVELACLTSKNWRSHSRVVASGAAAPVLTSSSDPTSHFYLYSSTAFPRQFRSLIDHPKFYLQWVFQIV